MYREPLTTSVGKPYCWQDALQQSLLPLQAYKSNFINCFTKITNYF